MLLRKKIILCLTTEDDVRLLSVVRHISGTVRGHYDKMNKINELIGGIIKFGLSVNVKSENNVLEIRQLLTGIYLEFLILEAEYEPIDRKDPPNFEYKEIRSIVESNFPNLGMYHSIFDSHKLNGIADLVTEDSIDDLTDIIKDMMSVNWRFKNNSDSDALYHFQFAMKYHSEQHLVNLIKYLKYLTG